MPKKRISVKNRSAFTGVEHTMEMYLDPEHLKRWQEGEHIQVVMPYLTSDEREFLMTGVTPQEWKDAFGEEQ